MAEAKSAEKVVSKDPELSKDEILSLKKKELEESYAKYQKEFNETIAELRYIERLLSLKEKKDVLEGKMKEISEEYQNLK